MENSPAGRLREALRRSHVAIAMIALLYLWAIGAFFAAMQEAWHGFGLYAVTAMAIRGAPSTDSLDRWMFHSSLWIVGDYLFRTVADLTFAWLVARQAYGTGPLRALAARGKLLLRRSHA